MNYDISVIIPMYNASEFIVKTLQSVENQTFQGNIEVICIDDCSTDNTLEVVQKFKESSLMSMRILKQSKNMRQGTARNRGLIEAKGTYIFFLDSDDFLDSNTFESMYKKAEYDLCDFVVCGWVYYYEDDKEVYVNNDLFMSEELLTDQDCEKLYQADSYFTVNKLYNRSFILDHNITYGEGYIYEDLEFYVKVAQYAERIGIVSNPFYKIRINQDSTTKTNYTTTLHMDDYIKSLGETLVGFEPRHKHSYYMTYKYFLYRALLYADRRVPRKYKKHMIKEVVALLNEKNTDYEVPSNIVTFNQLYFRERLVQRNKIDSILLTHYLQKKGKLEGSYKAYKKFIKRPINKLKNSKINKKRRIRAMNKIKRQSKIAPLKNKVLFLGFDYRYMGNSKYLYEYISKHHPEIIVRFVTKSQAVPQKHRIQPRSAEFWKALGESNVVITESWTPLPFFKKEGSLWIQLWHGTPYKKMFFDSHEKYITRHNRNHKRHKKQDIEKWDFLIADSMGAVDLFSSAFSKSRDKIVPVGYPRVQWLIEQQQNEAMKQKIKNDLSIHNDQHVILYAPTWRDYNFKNNKPDMDYLLDSLSLMESLGKEYILITKIHGMEKRRALPPNVINIPANLETQELLLISDTVISDYSSIIFDVLPMRKKIALYTNDREKYQEARGTYEIIDQLLQPFIFDNEESLLNFVRSPMNNEQKDSYNQLLFRYGNVSEKNSNESIVEIIHSHMNG